MIINTALLGDLTIEIILEGSNVLTAGCTWPIIPTNALSTVGAGGIGPISDIGALTIAIADTVKAAAAADA